MLSFRGRRRRRLRSRGAPSRWATILDRRVAHWRGLEDADRRELAGHMHVFLAEKRFEGCGGMRISEEVRVTIAAQACLLLLHRESDDFPGLQSVLVYPTVYWAPRARGRPGGVVEWGQEVREGESWARGAVILAWDRVARDAEAGESGHNVVLHEFAHQLDAESGATDGAPALSERGSRRAWARAFSRAFGDHRQALADGRPTLLGAYAGESPAEFFAVAVETFFEKPEALCRFQPALYAHLAAYFCQEPASWPGRARAPALGAEEGSASARFWTFSVDRYGGVHPIV